MLVATLERRNRIADLLEEKGITPYRLADLVGMSRTAIYGLVNAEQIPDGTSYVTLRRVSRALGVGIDDLEEEPES